jgi:Ca2+-binding RTX toxin-like protein
VTVLRRFNVSAVIGLAGASLVLAIAALIPAKPDASTGITFSHTFSNGVLTLSRGEGNVVPRCANDGQITVSGVPLDEPGYCRDLKAIIALGSDSTESFDFSYLPDDLGGGQGPIELTAIGGGDSDKLTPAANHINVFFGGKGSDAATGGNLNDRLSGGPSGDKLDGAGGKDTLKGGPGGDKLIGGPGRDTLKGGPGGDKLIGGPGKDSETP